MTAFTDPRDYWGDAFVPLSKSFMAIALYRMATNLSGFELGDPDASEMLLREAAKMFWDRVISEHDYNIVRETLEPYLSKTGKARWKEILRQRHLKEYGCEP